MRRLISSIPSLLNFLLKSRRVNGFTDELTSRHQVPARIAVLALRRYEVSPQNKRLVAKHTSPLQKHLLMPFKRKQHVVYLQTTCFMQVHNIYRINSQKIPGTHIKKLHNTGMHNAGLYGLLLVLLPTYCSCYKFFFVHPDELHHSQLQN